MFEHNQPHQHLLSINGSETEICDKTSSACIPVLREDLVGCASSREAWKLSLIMPFAHPTILFMV
jgi:hypothetical protein